MDIKDLTSLVTNILGHNRAGVIWHSSVDDNTAMLMDSNRGAGALHDTMHLNIAIFLQQVKQLLQKQ